MPVATLDALILTNNDKSVVSLGPPAVCASLTQQLTPSWAPWLLTLVLLCLVYLPRDPSALSCHHPLGEVLPQLWQTCTIKNKEPIKTKFDV